MDNLVGRKIAGRYNIKELIGMGGMAAVYKAECETLKRNVAVKVLLDNLNDDGETLDKFKKEAQAAARLSHNNIVSVYDVGEDNGINYMVMEYVEGETLKQYITENGPLPWREVCDFGMQIGRALTEAHANNVIHRDIKPQNILMTKDKVLKVTDFGIAKATGGSTVTMGGGSAVGSVHYISPEQARGGYTDERSDIYSLGAVIYEMLTGKVPFDGDTAVAVALMHIEKNVPDVLVENPGMPSAFKRVIEKCMAKEQFARYESVAELVSDLQSILDGFGVAEDDDDLGKTKIHSFSEEDLNREREKNAPYLDEDDYEEETSKKKGKKKKKIKTPEEKKADRVATISALLTIVLIAAIALGIYGFMLKKSGQARVPNLLNKTLEEATIEMTEKGLRLSDEVEYSLSDDVEEGRIISQNPDAGEVIKSSKEVIVVVSIGASGGNIAVPSVVGKTGDAAIEELLDAELTYEIKEEASEKVAEGKIIRQTPAAGTKVNKDETITVYLSTGKPKEVEDESKEVIVPKALGYKLSEAKAILEANNLELGTVAQKESDLPQGTVISQSPSSGKSAPGGTKVNLVISSGDVSEATEIPQPEVPSEDDEEPTAGAEVGVTKKYTLPIPSNGSDEYVDVKITVDDEIIYAGNEKRGSTVSVDITRSGTITIEAYIAGEMVNKKTVTFS